MRKLFGGFGGAVLIGLLAVAIWFGVTKSFDLPDGNGRLFLFLGTVAGAVALAYFANRTIPPTTNAMGQP